MWWRIRIGEDELTAGRYACFVILSIFLSSTYMPEIGCRTYADGQPLPIEHSNATRW